MTTEWPSARELVTARLTLEPLQVADAEELASLISDPALYGHIGDPPGEADLAARYRRQARGVSDDGRQGWINWVLRLRDGGEAVGVVQATLSERDGVLAGELAWIIATASQGAGLASEAGAAVAGSLRTLGVASLSVHIHPDNKASAAVARRLGLRPTTAVKDGEYRWTG